MILKIDKCVQIAPPDVSFLTPKIGFVPNLGPFAEVRAASNRVQGQSGLTKGKIKSLQRANRSTLSYQSVEPRLPVSWN
jgi:hypothetical protein